ncbi:unnamed protein product, partial [Gongylonema pulchrum]|uniref:LAM_G_DOMAIN domain-containing protein n=1 Tax=Gongylonema pulchrum TaxID=637853 RepID=A0A183ET38_9BILA
MAHGLDGEVLEPNKGTDDADGSNKLTSAEQVYHNDLIMRKVIGYVNNVKDRHNVELASRYLRDLSKKVPFISTGGNNVILDMEFNIIRPAISVKIAGNEFIADTLVSNDLHFLDGAGASQPERSLQKFQQIFKLFSRQTHQLMIGGIPDFHRELGFIPDHQ